MAVTVIAGLTSLAGKMIALKTFAIGWATAATAFAIGAGLSLVSRALMPSPNLGAAMGGRSITTREAAQSRKIVYGRARIGGNIVYLESTGTDNKYLWLVIAVAGHEIDAYEEVWFNDVKIWDAGNFVGGWGNYVSIGFHKGDQTTADSALNAASTKWTSDHKLLDTAYMVVKLTYDIDQFANGLPNISTVIRGKKVLNPATSTTAWSQNPALCVYDYLRDTKYGLGESVSNILTSSVTAAATVCDETVSLAAGGTQPRYTIDGVVDTEGSIKDNLDSMLGSMIGRLVFSAGKFELFAGEYVAPVYSVDESVAVGDISIQTKQSRRNAYNGVKGVFLSEDDNYILADYPAQLSSTFVAQDGDPIYLDMPLPFTVNNVRAQRIAKLALFRSRQQEAITIPCNLSALRFKIGDNINVTNARLGYSNKVFEVVGYNLDFSEGQVIVNVDAIETAASIWDWTTSDEEVYLGAGEVELYDGLTAAAPTSLNITGDSFLNSDGTFNTAFNVAWTDADDAFTDHYVVEWKKASDSNYFTMDAKASPAVITGLQNSQQYNVRVKAVNEIGVSSTYISSAPTAAVDTTAPALPTSISATAGYKSISLEWTNPSDKDFSNVEVYRATSSGGSFSEVATVGGGFGANAEFLNGGLADATTFYYKFKSVDYSGNKSAFTAEVSATTNAAAIDGTDGKSTFTAPIFKRATSAPSAPTGGTFNFGTNVLTAPSGWSVTIPSGTDPIYEATFQFSISGDTGTVTAGTWSTPVVIAENGTDGADGANGADGTDGTDGANGLSTFTFAVHKRASSTPSSPSGGSYNFTTNTITAPSGWSEEIPSGTDPVYISITKAQISGPTGTDSSLSWTTPVLFVENGADGTDGADGANGTNGTNGEDGPRNAAGYVYYSLSSANAPSSPSATSYNFSTGAFGGLTSNWSRTPPTNTGGDAKYWATSYYVTEATFGGTQTLTFGTPFASFQFDGLVTFTNLNSELADASSTEITTINGGLLKTGTIDVSQVNIAGTASAGISIKSAASGSRMEIESDVIKIYEGSTLRVQLGDLS